MLLLIYVLLVFVKASLFFVFEVLPVAVSCLIASSEWCGCVVFGASVSEKCVTGSDRWMLASPFALLWALTQLRVT